MDFSARIITVSLFLLYQLSMANSDAGPNTLGDLKLPAAVEVTRITVVAAAGKAKPRVVSRAFEPYQPMEGWSNPTEAAMAFYRINNAAYLSTSSDAELAGFLLISDTGQFFFTNAVDVPTSFTLQARVTGPQGWRVQDFLHTHPGGSRDQDGFSKTDQQAVLKGTKNYFLRTPDGDVRYLNTKLAKSTHSLSGAQGESLCPANIPCLQKHPRHNQRSAYERHLANFES
jgi:hypothetical protein